MPLGHGRSFRPGGAGLLVVRRSLCNTKVAPSQPGGGTIVFVTPTSQDYSPVLEQREDGGTPAIIQGIRVGLAFQIRKLVTVEHAALVQLRYVKSALARLGKHKNIYLIGGNRRSYWERARLPIVSFNILTPDENGPDEPSRIGPSVLRGGRKQLSPHFVAALLNDMFGIQGRSGCSCTGPYATRLMGWDEATTERCRQIVLRHSMEFAKPGWCALRALGARHAARCRPPVAAVARSCALNRSSLPRAGAASTSATRWTRRKSTTSSMRLR